MEMHLCVLFGRRFEERVGQCNNIPCRSGAVVAAHTPCIDARASPSSLLHPLPPPNRPLVRSISTSAGRRRKRVAVKVELLATHTSHAHGPGHEPASTTPHSIVDLFDSYGTVVLILIALLTMSHSVSPRPRTASKTIGLTLIAA